MFSRFLEEAVNNSGSLIGTLVMFGGLFVVMYFFMIRPQKKAGKADKLMECLAEVPNVRKDCGYPPLVTPSSQIVGTQAVMNIVMNERYKMVPKETKDLFAGKYGALPMPLNEEVAKKVLGNAERVTCK